MQVLFPGVPGGPELLVILLLLVALFGLPVVIAVLGWRHLQGDGRVDELESRVRELEAELEGVDTRDEPTDGDEAGGSNDSNRTDEPN